MNKGISKAGVIGAGVMGAAIAAHMANVGIEVILLDIVPPDLTEGDRNKGYTGTPLKAESVRDETMLKNTRARKLNGEQKRKNKRISKIRALGERPFAVIKQTFKNTQTHVTTLARNKIKDMFNRSF